MKRIKHTCGIILFGLGIVHTANAQSLLEIFQALPNEFLHDISDSQKDSLIENRFIPMPDTDTNQERILEIGILDSHYLNVIEYYNIGPDAFSTIELRMFKGDEGQIVVVYSIYGGLMRSYSQYRLVVFEYNNGQLKPTADYDLPDKIEPEEFLKEGVQDHIIDYRGLCTVYDLLPEEPNSIEYGLRPEGNEYEEYVQYYRILYQWNGRTFIQNKEKEKLKVETKDD